MHTAEERVEMIGRLEKLPGMVECAVYGLSDEQLDTPYREGGWTARQVVHHVADSHMNAFIRMKFILTEDEPALKPYDQDVWANLADAAQLPVDGSLSIIRGLHTRWTALLKSLPDSAWERSGYHPERGAVTIDRLLEIYAGHGEKHVAQIMGLRQKNAW
jgi:hypothetical protein